MNNMQFAASVEPKRIEIRRKLWILSKVAGRVPAPEMRARLTERLRNGGATDDEISTAFRQREECVIAVLEAMHYHRSIHIERGVLLVSGMDAEPHQEGLAQWNRSEDGKPSVAAIVWQLLNDSMGKYRQ